MKVKGFVNFLSKIGIRAVVFSAVAMGSVMVLFSGYSMYEQLYTQNRAFSSGSLSYDEGTSLAEVQDTFSKEREDYRAWLRISATHIDYPVMQGKDDLYYANHDVDGNSSLSGAIYLSAGNKSDLSDNYLVVFGHHMDNGAMFGDLDRFADSDFFENHRSGELVYPGGAYDIKFFAVLSTDAYDDMVYQTDGKNLDSLIAYLGRKAKIFKTPEEKAEKIIALSTCAGATTNGRLVLFGVMTEQKPTPTPTEPVTPTGEVSPTITKGPVVTDSPENTNTPTPTGATKTPTPTPTADVTETPTPTEAPSETPTPTETPVITEEPSPTPTVAPATPTPTESPEENETPDKNKKKSWIDRINDWFTPNGSSYGTNAWALINLICLIVTFYVLCPLHGLRRKYRRIGMMRKFNLTKSALWNADGLDPAGLAERERIMTSARGLFRHDSVTSQEFDRTVEHLFYQVGSFTKRFIAGIAIEAVLVILAIVTFIKTENMRQPMILIDKWTALMLLFVILSCAADWFLARYRAKKNA